jgi:hypothetical protein
MPCAVSAGFREVPFCIGVTFYVATGPLELADGAMFGLVQAWYPGGWLGNGSHVPYNGAGALYDCGYTNSLNHQIDPNFIVRDPPF